QALTIAEFCRSRSSRRGLTISIASRTRWVLAAPDSSLLCVRLRFCRSFRLVCRDSNGLDFQSLIHIEALLSIQTFHEFASGLSNRTTDTGGIDLDSAAFRTCFSIFIFQCDVV